MRIKPLRMRSWRFKVLALSCSLPLLGGLSSCAGTPWGDTLSGSFPSPPIQATPEREMGTGARAPQVPVPGELTRSREATTPANGSGSPPESQPSTSPAPGAKPPGPQAPKRATPKPKPPSVASAPTPYRVTIRLPEADPSAPAEGVTEALRTAGIPFEVETIERMKGASPQPSKMPLQEPSPSPSVRPAPPPR